MLAVKICISEWNKASRDKREMSVCRELGMDVLVMAKGKSKDKHKKDTVDSFNVLRFSTRPLGEKVPNSINRFVSIFTWAKYAKSLNADILSCHDIIALLIGYLSNILKLKSKKAKLVYDSHEFEIGRSSERSKLAKFAITHLERFLMKRCAFSIMVNDTIADEVKRIHKLKERPIVVRSTPSYWDIDDRIIKQKRKELLDNLSLPVDTFTIMYHGGIMNDRGIETVIELVSLNKNICGIILGNGDEKYLKSLQTLAQNKGVSERIIFHPAVPIDELWKYVGAADVGMVILKNICSNHYYSLPNKFFENIQSLTPIIGSNFPEIKRIIDQYQIGLTCDPESVEDLNHCIEKMHLDNSFYNKCKENLLLAKKELCWENEKEILKEVYGRYI